MTGLLASRSALVTGGGRGVGRAIVEALSAAGADVAIDDIYVDADGNAAADVAAAEISGAGRRALALRHDITTEAGAAAMVAETVEAFGALDILVNCAGNVVKSPLVDLSVDQWDSVMSLHLKGHFLACRAALKPMIERDYGRIITVGSRAAFWDLPANKREVRPHERKPSSTAYCAAKAGIMAMSTALAIELWETGITVNCLLPSANTQLFPGTVPNPVGGIPAPISLDPEYIGPVIAYVVSEAAKDISGRIFYAAGGDVCLYGQPFRLDGGGKLLRKNGMWTAEELAETLPSLVGISS